MSNLISANESNRRASIVEMAINDKIIEEFMKKLAEREREMKMSWDNMGRIEKIVNESENYQDRVLPF